MNEDKMKDDIEVCVMYRFTLSILFAHVFVLSNLYMMAGCSLRVEPLGNFEGNSRVLRQNWGAFEKKYRSRNRTYRDDI